MDKTGSYQNPLSFFILLYRALLNFPVKSRTFKINVVAYLSLIVDHSTKHNISLVLSFTDSDTGHDFVYNGHGYRVIPSSGAMDWIAMSPVCDDLGMQPVAFQTAEEYVAIRDYILTCKYIINTEYEDVRD